jgi:hypothetical protein
MDIDRPMVTLTALAVRVTTGSLVAEKTTKVNISEDVKETGLLVLGQVLTARGNLLLAAHGVAAAGVGLEGGGNRATGNSDGGGSEESGNGEELHFDGRGWELKEFVGMWLREEG